MAKTVTVPDSIPVAKILDFANDCGCTLRRGQDGSLQLMERGPTPDIVRAANVTRLPQGRRPTTGGYPGGDAA